MTMDRDAPRRRPRSYLPRKRLQVLRAFGHRVDEAGLSARSDLAGEFKAVTHFIGHACSELVTEAAPIGAFARSVGAASPSGKLALFPAGTKHSHQAVDQSRYPVLGSLKSSSSLAAPWYVLARSLASSISWPSPRTSSSRAAMTIWPRFSGSTSLVHDSSWDRPAWLPVLYYRRES
jgi:hypothetical protein